MAAGLTHASTLSFQLAIQDDKLYLLFAETHSVKHYFHIYTSIFVFCVKLPNNSIRQQSLTRIRTLTIDQPGLTLSFSSPLRGRTADFGLFGLLANLSLVVFNQSTVQNVGHNQNASAAHVKHRDRRIENGKSFEPHVS